MSSEPLRVAVVGGGVCGLTCAVGLLKQGVDVHVYEAAVSFLWPNIKPTLIRRQAKFGEVGAGIALGKPLCTHCRRTNLSISRFKDAMR